MPTAALPRSSGPQASDAVLCIRPEALVEGGVAEVAVDHVGRIEWQISDEQVGPTPLWCQGKYLLEVEFQ